VFASAFGNHDFLDTAGIGTKRFQNRKQPENYISGLFGLWSLIFGFRSEI
jgi:hypothetical protein